MRPLDFLGSIKLKLGAVIVAAVAVTVAVVSLGERVGLSTVVTGIVAAAVALVMVQLLAHGMTFPLREMVAAARAMARGDYGRRVTATSRDEVGELARAFNTMAGELAEVDRMRRSRGQRLARAPDAESARSGPSSRTSWTTSNLSTGPRSR
jgi:methyl-accepting chemotaxis protein